MSKNDLWTEKYRPKTIEELDCSSFLKKFLQNATVNGFPHLLLYGPPGTGKTTFASLLNPTFELNASDDRGIEIIRNKIKKVANTVSKQVIVLDECENLTKDSQTCLRRFS
jgi:DNA polymerase III delta prime subunit